MKGLQNPEIHNRKIIHADMDAFYASVEVRENPNLKGKPIIVGGSPQSRSVVCSASYEARKFGVHSAMPCALAKKLCPDAIFIPPNFSLYVKASREIQNIFFQYTHLVEFVSLDEAYLDVTENKLGMNSATRLAELLQKEVLEKTKLTVSCGVSYNKFLAKVASDWKKPNGLFVIRPHESQSFLDQLPIEKFYGIGKKTSEKFQSMGIRKGEDLRRMSLRELQQHFGKMGAHYYYIVRGIDTRPVSPHRERKSLGIEDTFPVDLDDEEVLMEYLENLVDGLMARMDQKNIQGRCLTVKIKYFDFTVQTIQTTHSSYLTNKSTIYKIARDLFYKAWNGKKVRLLGLSVSKFQNQEDWSNQLFLFS